MTTCNLYSCQREEQCDDCWFVDHQKECAWCEFYDHEGYLVVIKKMSGLKETAQYFVYEMQPKIIGKFFDIESPIGF